MAPMRFLLVALCGWIFCVAEDIPKIHSSDTLPEYLGQYGIRVERHWATTTDGFHLGIFRMARPGAPVVLLQHGILCSSWHWVLNSPSISPGIQLYKEGYDVWMTNSRGNTYSKNHTKLQPTLNKEFWNFSFSDMGRLDVPANIEYILKNTGKPDLTFVGWSQGTSQFFVAMTDAKVKAYVDKTVNLFVALAPVSFMGNQSSKLLGIPIDSHVDQMWNKFFPYGFLSWNSAPAQDQLLCKLTLGRICQVGVDLVCGRTPLDTNGGISNLAAHFPAGTSAKSLEHYGQLVRSNRFQEFDYGSEGNLQQYGQTVPPAYDVANINVPTALFIGENDDMGDAKDNAYLIDHINGNPALVYHRTFPEFSHITYFVGTEASFQEWYPDFLGLLHKYNPVRTQLV